MIATVSIFTGIATLVYLTVAFIPIPKRSSKVVVEIPQRARHAKPYSEETEWFLAFCEAWTKGEERWWKEAMVVPKSTVSPVSWT